MEKIILKIEEGLIINEVNKIQTEVFPLIKRLSSEYSTLKIGKFDKEALQDICGRGKAKKAKGLYLQLVEADVAKMGITAPALIKKFKRDAESDIENLIQCANQLAEFSSLFNFFSIENEEPVITENDMNAIREKYTIYISSQAAIKARELQVEVANKLNEFIEYMNSKNPNIVFLTPFAIFNLFLSYDENVSKYKALPIDFERLVNK